MKTKQKRLEDLEAYKSSNIEMQVITQDLENEELFKYENKQIGEIERMTLEEAETRFKDGVLFVVKYESKKLALKEI